MEGGLFRAVAGPSDIKQRSPIAVIFDIRISERGMEEFLANPFTSRKGSIRSSFAGSLSDAGSKHFSINCFKSGSLTLDREAGFIPYKKLRNEITGKPCKKQNLQLNETKACYPLHLQMKLSYISELSSYIHCKDIQK
jgi:hypothetical protein